MGGIRAFVSEHSIYFEDPVETTDDAALEEQFRRDPQVQIDVESIGMRDERPRRRATRQRLQHRRFDFEKPPPFECVAYRADHGDSLPRHRAGLGTDDQVDVALPHPRLFAHLLVGHGQGPQRLGRQLPGIGEDGQFAAA